MNRSPLLLPGAALAAALGLGCGDQPPPTAPADPPAAMVKQLTFTATALGNAHGAAAGINDGGQVAGTQSINGLDRAFLWYKGTITELAAFPGRQGSSATAINNNGQVVGISPTSGFPHAVFWDRGVITDLGTLPGAVYSLSSAYAINERRQIAGYSSSAVDFGNDHAVVWENGKITDLGAPPQGASYARDINDRGEVVGWSQAFDAFPRATLWAKGTITDLGLLPGAVYSYAFSINDRGQVVGASGKPVPDAWEHAVLWDKGVLTDLGSLPGGSNSFAFAINDAGEVAGMSDIGGGDSHAVIWRRGIIHDLGIGQAYGINNRGQVVGIQVSGPTLWSVD